MSVNDLDYVAEMFAAISKNNIQEFKACFSPGAVIWHCDDEIELDVDAVCGIMGGLHAASVRGSVAYREQRVVHAGQLCFVQHVLTSQLCAGGQLRVPAMMRIELDDAGLVARIEEYYDSRAIDCLKPE
ncbi:hypothetical protein DOK_12161 [gamma proteobacterium BDW918]|nr:hypothetical protein DOK_12161 [gamma proteobacterium BDW918]